MTKPLSASELGLEPHFKVRVVLPGSILHVASRTEPVVATDDGVIVAIAADWIDDPRLWRLHRLHRLGQREGRHLEVVGVSERLLIGDEGYLEMLEAAYDAGHITGDEAAEQLYLHELVVRGREAAA